MGTVVAQDIFQYKLAAIFIGMEGVTGIADDMVIAGKDEMEHDRNFLAFMEKSMESNLTITTEKTQQKHSLSNAVQHIAFHQTHRRTLFSAMQNFHQAWKVCYFSQVTSSCKERRKPHWGPN